MLPPPSNFVIPGMFRDGINLNIYENVGVVNVTAQANLVCPGGTPGPSQPSPELITGISIGIMPPGCIVLAGGVPTIPEMLVGTDAVTFGSISVAPGVTTLVLPIPLIGNYTEKWMYDMQAGFGESYKGSTIPRTRDNMRGVTFQGGLGVQKTFKRDEKLKRISGSGRLSAYQATPEGREFVGPFVHDIAQRGSNYVHAYKPSLIKTLRFHYEITVTSTCPPYIWKFPAFIDVDNNWQNHTKRTKYRLSKQTEAREG
jgi:hypothetical protein